MFSSISGEEYLRMGARTQGATGGLYGPFGENNRAQCANEALIVRKFANFLDHLKIFMSESSEQNYISKYFSDGMIPLENQRILNNTC